MPASRLGGLYPPSGPVSNQGRLVVRKMADGSFVIQAAPRKRSKNVSGFQFRRQMEFGWCGYQTKLIDPVMRQTCVELAKGSPYTWRDIAMMCIMGTYYGIEFADGTQLVSYRMSQPDPQFILDLVTSTPGAILWRSPVGWIGIPPGDDGQVLTMVDSAPAWQNASGGGGSGSPDFLPPLAADFPNRTGVMTLTDSPRGLGLYGTPALNAMAIATKSFDNGSNQSWQARIINKAYSTNNPGIYMLAQDSTTTKMLAVGLTNYNLNEQYIEGQKWTSPTTVLTGYGGGQAPCGPVWFKLDYTTATNTLTGRSSWDGINWDTLFTDNTFLAAPDQIGFGAAYRATSGRYPTGAITYFA